ncbi:MAG: N-acetylmuramoyl-L-alanine amidase [Deltaproteobacteria bacterium]|nr:N-acetylmuramoyl-L-alanine amidase [Deltaproteobacteria bacterium]
MPRATRRPAVSTRAPRVAYAIGLVTALVGPIAFALVFVWMLAAVRACSATAPAIVTYPDDFGVRRIMIDAGHGGENEGTRTWWGRREKTRTLELALGLAEHLRATGRWEALLTREADIDLPNSQRPEIANAAGVDLYISLHANGAMDEREGFGVIWYLAQNDPRSETLANAVATSLAAAGFARDFSMGPRFTEPRGPGAPEEFTYQRTHESLPVYVRERNDHRMIWPATMPAVLIETHYMTNPVEAWQFTFDRTRERLYSAIERGLVDAIGAGVLEPLPKPATKK